MEVVRCFRLAGESKRIVGPTLPIAGKYPLRGGDAGGRGEVEDRSALLRLYNSLICNNNTVVAVPMYSLISLFIKRT